MAEQKPTTPEPTKPTTSLFNFFGTSKPVDLPKNKREPKQTAKKGYVTRSTRKIATKLVSMKHKIVGIMNTTINDLVHKMDCKPKMVRRTRKRKNIVMEPEQSVMETEEEPAMDQEAEAQEELAMSQEAEAQEEPAMDQEAEAQEEPVMETEVAEEQPTMEQKEEQLEIGKPLLGGKRHKKRMSKRKYSKK
jgi:hypothetical protein